MAEQRDDTFICITIGDQKNPFAIIDVGRRALITLAIGSLIFAGIIILGIMTSDTSEGAIEDTTETTIMLPT